jgi:high affinity sulfate transporter 1
MLATVERFVPGLRTLRTYEMSHLRFDIAAGLSVAAVALPVGIAYADIARVPAVIGIYSAIFPLFAYALFGSSRQLMTGPDAATCIMAAAAVGAIAGGDPGRYAATMVAMTLLTGLFYVAAGILRLGFVANFLSHPILIGYLNGIALLVLIGQLPKLFGFAPGTGGFFRQFATFVESLERTHVPTLILGVALLVLLVALRRFAPRIPAPLVVVVAGIAAVQLLNLSDRGVAVLGEVPAGLPKLGFPSSGLDALGPLMRDAAGLMLISFTSGVLTSKSFAQRSGYDVDANQELIGFGACNIASGLVQGFPVTGADSRTAVNCAMGGRTQLVGIVAGATMLVFLIFLTAPLAQLPTAALAAIIVVSACGLFDFAATSDLRRISRRELSFSLTTTVGVLVLGVLPGVLIAVVLSLLWLLWLGLRPHDAVLGRRPGSSGWHDMKDFPDARAIPGLLVYRFDANLVFFNCDYFKERVREHIASASTPVEWVVVDISPVNVVDYTAVHRLKAFREELEARGILLGHARGKHALARFFRPGVRSREFAGLRDFGTLEAAVEAFGRRGAGK